MPETNPAPDPPDELFVVVEDDFRSSQEPKNILRELEAFVFRVSAIVRITGHSGVGSKPIDAN